MTWDGIDRRNGPRLGQQFRGRKDTMSETTKTSDSNDTLDTLRRAYAAGRTIWPVVVLIAMAAAAYVRTDYRITRLEEARVESESSASKMLDALHGIDKQLSEIKGELKSRREDRKGAAVPPAVPAEAAGLSNAMLAPFAQALGRMAAQIFEERQPPPIAARPESCDPPE